MKTPAQSNSFYAVSALSRTDVWAVGSHYDGVNDRPLAEHFDGRSWTTVTVPSPGPGAAYLRGVLGFASNDVWAGGYQTAQSGAQKTLIEHYDGTLWTIIASPNPASIAAYLSSLVAFASDNVWASGYYISNSGVYRTLVEHWDGGSWTIVPSPNAGAGDNALNCIAGTQPNDIWAVGYGSLGLGSAAATLVLHFDGTSWSVVPSPNPGGLTSSLSSVTALVDGTIWAAGFYSDGTRGRTLLLHGVGSSLTVFPGEDFPGEGNVLNGIAASAAGDIWAVGYHYPTGTSDYQGLIEHYDGQIWRQVTSAQGGSYTYLSGITAQPSGAGWAVGNTLTTTLAQSICEIQVDDEAISPRIARASQGNTVGWSLIGSATHEIVETSGLNLFDSGARVTGTSFQFAFNSAGSYPVSDQISGATSTVAIPVQVPAKGRVNKPLTVTWSTAPPANGFVFDAQVQIPGGTFQDWITGQTLAAANYLPAASGDYLFRARLRDGVSGASSNWSPPGKVNVSAP